MLPILNWKESSPVVQDQGISGRLLFPSRSSQEAENITANGTTNGSHPASDAIEGHIVGPGNDTAPVCKEIEAFISQRWPETKELMWIVNPVKLQSVPGLVRLPGLHSDI